MPSDVHRQNFLGTQHSGCGDIDKAVNLTEAPTSWPTPDSKLNLFLSTKWSTITMEWEKRAINWCYPPWGRMATAPQAVNPYRSDITPGLKHLHNLCSSLPKSACELHEPDTPLGVLFNVHTTQRREKQPWK